MPLVYRTTGAWGPGKGSPLTKAEGDGNIWDLDRRVVTLEGSIPAAARGVNSVIQPTADTFSFVMTDASTEGPFSLPTTQYPFTGSWIPLHAYLKYQRFNKNGSLYEVNIDHTSLAVFSPTSNDGLGHDFYSLLLANPAASLPTGGPAGWLLSKLSSTDFDFAWKDPTTLALAFSSLTGVATAAQIPVATASTIGGVKTLAAAANKFLTSIDSTGLPVAAQPAFTDISGTISLGQLPTLPAAPTPLHSQFTASITLDIAYANTYAPFNSGSTANATIPPFSSVAWVVGTEITFRVVGTGQLTIVAGAGVTLNVPAGFLAKSFVQGATMTIKNVSTNVWDLFGLLATV